MGLKHFWQSRNYAPVRRAFVLQIVSKLPFATPGPVARPQKQKQNKNLGLNPGSVPWGHASRANRGVDFEGSDWTVWVEDSS